MESKTENKLPALIESELLNNLLQQPDFDKKYRIIEANLGIASRPDYEKSHIKNAIFFDSMMCFEPTKYLPRDWPKPDEFGKYLTDLGLSDKHGIIIYDRSPNGFTASSRVWMHLRAYGNENVSILKGGFSLWTKNNYQVTNDIKTYSKGDFKIRENKLLSKDYESILNALKTNSVQFVDVRSREDFNKENSMLGKNHIPGAKNFPYSELFDPKTGTIKDKTEIIDMFENAGIDFTVPTILYCNSSVTASSVAFAAYIIGYENIPVYKGSWTEYSLKKQEEIESIK